MTTSPASTREPSMSVARRRSRRTCRRSRARPRGRRRASPPSRRRRARSRPRGTPRPRPRPAPRPARARAGCAADVVEQEQRLGSGRQRRRRCNARPGPRRVAEAPGPRASISFVPTPSIEAARKRPLVQRVKAREGAEPGAGRLDGRAQAFDDGPAARARPLRPRTSFPPPPYESMWRSGLHSGRGARPFRRNDPVFEPLQLVPVAARRGPLLEARPDAGAEGHARRRVAATSSSRSASRSWSSRSSPRSPLSARSSRSRSTWCSTCSWEISLPSASSPG